MERIQERQHTLVTAERIEPANDNRTTLPAGRSEFPMDATARIYRPCRSAMTSGRAGSKGWRLVFERRSKPFIEPLMGYTGSDDTLVQVELNFPTLQSAIDYAERQGIAYVVQGASQPSKARGGLSDAAKGWQAGSDVIWPRLQLARLQSSYGAVSQAPHYETALSDPEALYATPMDVVADPLLTVDEKRAVLRNWVWNEYLIDLATAEGMPENARPTRFDEMQLALLALERTIGASNVSGSISTRMRSAATDPLIVFDREKAVPNRYALAIAAAQRAAGAHP